MSAATSIEWTDRTWNPVRGCSRVSDGCRNCYAEKIAARFSGPGQPFEGFATRPSFAAVEGGRKMTREHWTGRVELIPSALDEPLRWNKPCRVFVNSMSDLFHESLPDEAIDAVFVSMSLASRHTFQILTKRAQRMRDCFAKPITLDRVVAALKALPESRRIILRTTWVEGGCWKLGHVWLGVSVEDQATADERIPLLLQTPAAVRFVSYEPALGPVDFTGWLHACDGGCDRADCKPGPILDWIIVGGESGPGARPFDLAWARSTVAQCNAAGVPVFVKQLGAHVHGVWDAGMAHLSTWRDHIKQTDRKGGDPSEWPEDLRVREFPR